VQYQGNFEGMGLMAGKNLFYRDEAFSEMNFFKKPQTLFPGMWFVQISPSVQFFI
jgi:hypothetical protein